MEQEQYQTTNLCLALDRDITEKLRTLARIKSVKDNRTVTAQDLIRQAINKDKDLKKDVDR